MRIRKSRGNCLLGALVLMARKRTWRVCATATWWPHFYVIDRNGLRWHFVMARPLLPPAFRYAWFLGYYRAMPDGYLDIPRKRGVVLHPSQ